MPASASPIPAVPIATRGPDVLTPAQRLLEAEAAYHRLSTGASVAEVRDSDGSGVKYRPADLPDLVRYIADLKRLIGGVGQPKTIKFHTSKGV